MNLLDRDHWREIFEALKGNKLRTFLTAFGVFWGIFMLMVMLGSGNGLQNGVNQGFSDGATNSVFIWTQRTSKPYKGLPAGRSLQLDMSDARAIREQVPDLAVVAPRNQLGGYGGGNNVSRGTKSGAFNIYGDYPEISSIQSVRVVAGRFLNPMDMQDRRKVCVIGARVKEVLFGAKEEAIGEDIRINGVYFKVVGIFKPSRGGNDAERDTQSVYIPFTTYQIAFNNGDRVGWFAVTSKAGVPASVAEKKTLALLRERHRVHPEDERAFGHFNLEEEFGKIQGLFFGIRTLIWIVGIGTLAAGVIGVSNIMLVIVRERTNEIGLRRAVGATPFAIMAQVVFEALVLTSAAGYLGLMIGMGLVDLVSKLLANVPSEMFANPEVAVASALKILVIIVVAGILAGVIPARRAVKVSPVVALRNL